MSAISSNFSLIDSQIKKPQSMCSRLTSNAKDRHLFDWPSQAYKNANWVEIRAFFYITKSSLLNEFPTLDESWKTSIYSKTCFSLHLKPSTGAEDTCFSEAGSQRACPNAILYQIEREHHRWKGIFMVEPYWSSRSASKVQQQRPKFQTSTSMCALPRSEKSRNPRSTRTHN